MRTDRSEEGFTLTELLAVVLIIGTLAAIAIPAFLHTRRGAYDDMMASDLRPAVSAELAYSATNDTWTTEPADLETEGYRISTGVTPVHVRLVGEAYVACVKHEAAAQWLVYDGASGTTSKSSSDCA